MPSILESFTRVIHDTSAALIDHEIPRKVSDLAAATVKSGFEIVEETLTIVKELTAPEEP